MQNHKKNPEDPDEVVKLKKNPENPDENA